MSRKKIIFKNKTLKKGQHIGSDFDDFLREEGVLEEIEEIVVKRVFVYNNPLLSSLVHPADCSRSLHETVPLHHLISDRDK